MIADLASLMPGFDWGTYLNTTGITGRTDFVIIRQPSYFTGLDGLIASTPLPVWKAYFKWRVLSSMAPFAAEELRR